MGGGTLGGLLQGECGGAAPQQGWSRLKDRRHLRSKGRYSWTTAAKFWRRKVDDTMCNHSGVYV